MMQNNEVTVWNIH